jgi:ketosteroid isomerase-like protein
MTLKVNRLLIIIIAGLLLALVGRYEAVGNPKFSTGPTAENALVADQQLALALQNNDTPGIYRMLDKDWAVISTHGGVAEGPSVFPSGVSSGFRTLTKMVLSAPRVRMFGNVALVTTKVNLAGQLGGKTFDMMERQTDVWRWEQGGWKCILTQESNLLNP